MTTLLDLIPARGGPRECGPGRQEGHIYAECGFSPHGVPIEHFLIDLPIPVNPGQLGLSSQGVTFIERQGTWHVVDVIGESHYPCAADFVEEAKALGVSRKIPRTGDFGRLTRESTLILIHPRGRVTNSLPLASFTSGFFCPCGHGHSAHEPCAGYHWYAAEANVPGTVKRRLKRTSYEVRPLLSGAPALEFTPAYILRVPISNLSVIRNRDGSVNRQSRAVADKARLPVIDADA